MRPASVINPPGAKRKAVTPAEGRPKRPALASDIGTPDDTTFSRENGKLVIMFAQNIWSTLTTLGNTLAQSHTIFGMPVTFSVPDLPEVTERGLRLSTSARAQMANMHQSILYCALIQYGLQGSRVQQQPTFEPGERYSPTHVFPPGSDKAVYITPKSSPAMPVADNQQPVAASTPPTPSRPSGAATRRGAGPAKQRAKKGSVSSVCIPDVQRGDDGVLLNLEAGVQVPIAGLSKNQQKKLARQAKRQPLNDNGQFAAAIASRDVATATKQFEKHTENLTKAPASAPAAGGETGLRIPPPRPAKQLRQCKKIKDALDEGGRKAANGEVQLPPTSSHTGGHSRSITAEPGELGTDSGSNDSAADAGKPNSSPAQPTSATSASAFPNSAPPQGSQAFQHSNQFQAQQQHNTVQPFEPQLLVFDGQAEQPQQWTGGFQSNAQFQHGGQSHQPSGTNTGHGDEQKENQQPAPVSVDQLLKATGMTAPTGRQGYVINPETPKQSVVSFTNIPNSAVQAQPDAPTQASGVATNNIIESWNGMPVIGNEVQTDGYDMQPLAAVMPPGTAPKITLPDPAPADTAAGDDVQPDAEQDDDAFMRELFGDDFTEFLEQAEPEDGVMGLTEDDLIAVRMQRIEEENARDAANLALLDTFNKEGADNGMSQHDGSASPIPPYINNKKNNPANLNQDSAAASNPSRVLAAGAAAAQQQHQQARAPPSSTTDVALGAASVTTTNPEQKAALEAYKAQQLRAAREFAERQACDGLRDRYLAANRDLPSQAEREKRARRKRAHERLAELRYITAEARVFPLGSAQRVGFEESIAEMAVLEGEIKAMGDKVLADREYVVVRREGYRVEEHWIPEEK